MSENKTMPTDQNVDGFIAAVENKRRREDALVLNALFKEITGWELVMWGPTIIGFGQYEYSYKSGRTGVCNAAGFSPRKANQTLYIMPGYQDLGHLLEKLGKHKTGACCLYINKLADIDLDVLKQIIIAGLDDLATQYPVTPPWPCT